MSVKLEERREPSGIVREQHLLIGGRLRLFDVLFAESFADEAELLRRKDVGAEVEIVSGIVD